MLLLQCCDTCFARTSKKQRTINDDDKLIVEPDPIDDIEILHHESHDSNILESANIDDSEVIKGEPERFRCTSCEQVKDEEKECSHVPVEDKITEDDTEELEKDILSIMDVIEKEEPETEEDDSDNGDVKTDEAEMEASGSSNLDTVVAADPMVASASGWCNFICSYL